MPIDPPLPPSEEGPTPGRASAGPVQIKLLKWGLFTVGVVFFTTTADVLIAWIAGGRLSLERLFGHGELLLVSLGLLMAAAGELIFDRFLKKLGGVPQAVLVAFCFLMAVPISVAYGAIKNADPVVSVQEQATPDPGRTTPAKPHTSGMTILVFLASLALSTVAVAASERGRAS